MDYALENGVNFFDTPRCILFQRIKKPTEAPKIMELGLKKN
jgi:hypothetical protein